MNTIKPRFDRIAYALMALMVVAGSTGLARAQGITDTIPANASANTYRKGWRL